MGSNHFVNFFQYNTARDRNSLAISLIEKEKEKRKKEGRRGRRRRRKETEIFPISSTTHDAWFIESDDKSADLSGFVRFPLANLIDTQLARTRKITSVFLYLHSESHYPEDKVELFGGDRRKKNFLEMIIIIIHDRR